MMMGRDGSVTAFTSSVRVRFFRKPVRRRRLSIAHTQRISVYENAMTTGWLIDHDGTHHSLANTQS
jgi:hypothetical protein